jgi:hypothetical protein
VRRRRQIRDEELLARILYTTAGDTQLRDDETEELKEAMHQVEEEKGDWSKSH